MNKPDMLLPEIAKEISYLEADKLPGERKKLLQKLIRYIEERLKNKEPIRLNFICTHNSRRSQLAQLWAKSLAACSGFDIDSFSGGVEVTAFNSNAVKALKDSGFLISGNNDENPVYEVKFSEKLPPLKMFSKVFDDPSNPRKDFAAVMVCSDADENCPFVAGADMRIPLLYEDPKKYDGTPEQQEKYRERSLEIATEMKYVFEEVLRQQANDD